MSLPSVPQHEFQDSCSTSRERHRVVSVARRWRQVTCPLLIGMSLVLSYPSAAAHGDTIDFTSFYSAVRSGDSEAALAAGRDIYTRLAFQAEGHEPFYRMGTMLITARQAADHVIQLHAHPGKASDGGSASSLWRILQAPVPQPGKDSDADGSGRFLRDYLRLYVNHEMDRMLVVAAATSSMSDANAIATTDHMVLLLGMLDAEAISNQPTVAQTVAWISGRGQSGRAIAQAVEHARPLVACAVSRGRLAQTPADPGARKELVELVGQLCKAQRIQEALALCDWARDLTHDPAYGSVLFLQQAIIAARDQKDVASAIRLCDQAAATAGEPATVQLARHLAAVYCLNQGDYAEAIRRALSLAHEPTTTLPNKLKASTLAATAFLRQNKPEEAVRLQTAILDGLAEPEPSEAADGRQLLCQALLKMQHYDEAVRQCQVLMARHPGHLAAKTAKQAIEQFGPKDDAAAESAK